MDFATLDERLRKVEEAVKELQGTATKDDFDDNPEQSWTEARRQEKARSVQRRLDVVGVTDGDLEFLGWRKS